jgi:hypothetical protein
VQATAVRQLLKKNLCRLRDDAVRLRRQAVRRFDAFLARRLEFIKGKPMRKAVALLWLAAVRPSDGTAAPTTAAPTQAPTPTPPPDVCDDAQAAFVNECGADPGVSDADAVFDVYCADIACYHAAFNVTEACPSPCVDNMNRQEGTLSRSAQQAYKTFAEVRIVKCHRCIEAQRAVNASCNASAATPCEDVACSGALQLATLTCTPGQDSLSTYRLNGRNLGGDLEATMPDNAAHAKAGALALLAPCAPASPEPSAAAALLTEMRALRKNWEKMFAGTLEPLPLHTHKAARALAPTLCTRWWVVVGRRECVIKSDVLAPSGTCRSSGPGAPSTTRASQRTPPSESRTRTLPIHSRCQPKRVHSPRGSKD